MKERIKGLIDVDWRKIKALQPDDVKINTNINALKKSLKKHGFSIPFAVWKDGSTIYTIDGHTRKRALEELKHEGEEVPDKLKAFEIDAKDRKEAVEILVEVFNQKHNPFDNEVLVKWLKVEQVEVQDLDVINTETSLSDNDITPDNESKLLSDKFIVPPFSILDTKQGYWQERKRQWINMGIKSELGREDDLLDISLAKELGMKGTSVFDPVLCEIMYKWFNTPNGKIIDPFAGGSVRGIIASILGYAYYGNDLRQEQIEANYINAKEVLKDNYKMPKWSSGDSLNIDKIIEDDDFDMIFSCPPYADLEVYSKDKRDISNMEYTEFVDTYKKITHKTLRKLKDNRFAVFVVGDVRDKDGAYRCFVEETVNVFTEIENVCLYNHLILLDVLGTLPQRVSRYMNTRKIGKCHQNILVFFKGDIKQIKNIFPQDIITDIIE
jgi:hypothetical protein